MDIESLKERLSRLKVAVVGDVMLDRYIYGKVQRISPEAPVPILNKTGQSERLGGAANVALNVLAFGVQPDVFSVVGQDEPGRIVHDLFQKAQLPVKGLLTLPDRPTTVKTRIVSQGQQLLRIDEEVVHDLTESQTAALWDIWCRTSSDYDLVILQDYNKGVLSHKLISLLLADARQSGVRIAVDPKKQHFFDYKGVDLFKPNLKECSEALGREIEPCLEALTEASEVLRRRLHHRYTMITLSEKGIFLDDGQTQIILPTRARTVADVSGAGDTVIAVAALFMTAGVDMATFGDMGNRAAGQVVAEAGVVSVDSVMFWSSFC